MPSNDELKHQIFISFALENRNSACELKNQLENRGYKLWLTESEDIEFKEIDESKLFICCATTDYCKDEKRLKEHEYALDNKKPVIYVVFEEFENDASRFESLRPLLNETASLIYNHNDSDEIAMAISTLLQVCIFFKFK